MLAPALLFLTIGRMGLDPEPAQDPVISRYAPNLSGLVLLYIILGHSVCLVVNATWDAVSQNP